MEKHSPQQRLKVRAIRIVCLLALLTVAVVTFLQTPLSSFLRGPSMQAEAAASTLKWKAGKDGFEYTKLAVPLDYAQPKGKKIDLALVRLPASNKQQRIGSLLVNPGGPGASAVDYVVETAKTLSPKLRARFDIVAFDARGSGKSSPINCQTAKEQDQSIAQTTAFPSIKETIDGSQEFAQLCIKRNAKGILPYVSTLNTARDMDQVRNALGEKKLSYLGFSYGTYLGATYASLFPNNVRALVLDGAIDPTLYTNTPFAYDFQQVISFEREGNRFFDYCKKTPKECKFGSPDPAKAYDALVKRLDKTPLKALKTKDPRPVTGATAQAAFLVSLYARYIWPFLGEALYQADVNKDGTNLQYLADFAYNRNPDGSYDPGDGAFSAINCVDRSYPHNAKPFERYLQWARKVAPRFWQFSSAVCAFWNVQANARYTGPFQFKAKGTPILVIGTTFDPATPYQGAISLAKQLGNARLLTKDGDGHTASGDTPCIDTKIDDYLLTLKVPAQGTVCKQVTTQVDKTTTPATVSS